MTKKLDETIITPEGGEESKKLSLEEVKILLSKKNTASKLSIIQGPMGCLLGMALFDQSPECKQIGGLGFTVLAELDGSSIGLSYGVSLHKSQATIEGDDLVVPGKIIQTDESESPIGKEKFIFLPEGTEVKVKYNQDTGTGELEIIEYPLDLYEGQEATASESEFIGTNFISGLTKQLDTHFIQLDTTKKTAEKGLDKEIMKTKSDIIKSILFLKKFDDATYKSELYSAIQTSPEYKRVRDEIDSIKQLKEAGKTAEIEFYTLEQEYIEKIKGYVAMQEYYIEKIGELTNREDSTPLKTILSEAYTKGIFAIADTFIAQDGYQATYRDTSWEKRPEYVKGDLNTKSVHKIIDLLIKIDTQDPTILKEIGICDQIKESIHVWRTTVQDNVKNHIYNPFTRSDAIRYRDLRNLLGVLYTEDADAFNDMVDIFRLLVEQRHPDGTNSGSFTGCVKDNIYQYIQSHDDLLGVDTVYTVTAFPYLDKEKIKALGCFDIDSDFWQKAMINCIKADNTRKEYDHLYTIIQRMGNITSSAFPGIEIEHMSKYIQFWEDFIQLQHYAFQKTGELDQTKLFEEGKKQYATVSNYEAIQKEKRGILIEKGFDEAKKLFDSFSAEQRKAYFEKVYDTSRGENHSTGLCAYKEFEDGKIITVISEHSDYGSRGGIQRDSQLDLYVNNETIQKASTGYQNYRDRYSSENDRYHNQYRDVLDVTQNKERYKIKTTQGDNCTQSLDVLPDKLYTLDIEVLSKLEFVDEQHKILFGDVLKALKQE